MPSATDGPMTLAEAERLVNNTPIAQLDDGTLARLANAENGASDEERYEMFRVISKASAEIDKRTVGDSVIPDMVLLREALKEEKDKAAELEVANEECKKRMSFLREMILIEERLEKAREEEKRLMEQKTNGAKRVRYEKTMAPNSCFAKCKRACRRFEEFHTMKAGSADVESVRKSSAGIEGWASSA